MAMERMKNKKKKAPAWSDVKAVLERLEQPDLLALISDLYHASQDNRTFLHARYSVGDDVLGPYRKIIEQSMDPDVLNEEVDIVRAKKAIEDYSKAVRNVQGEAELLTYFVECGHRFTLAYGDIDEEFYDTLLEVYNEAIKKVLGLPTHQQEGFRKRLGKIMRSSDGIGWGYHDGLCEEYYAAFGEG